MRASNVVVMVSLLSGIAVASVAEAHHSYSALFDSSKTVTISGEVTEFQFQNPHGYILVTVTSEAREPVVWEIETTAIGQLIRHGLTPSVLHPGDQISVVGNRSRDGRRLMRLLTITMPNGERKEIQK